jgi:riboflavin synthase
MFTGIVQCVGHVLASESRGGDRRMQFASSLLGMDDVRVGDSIAVSGVCLTALDVGADHFAADVSLETLRLTTLGALAVGAPVNLEKALRLSDRLGGHLVSGHVDGLGTVIDVQESKHAANAGHLRCRANWRATSPARVPSALMASVSPSTKSRERASAST